MRTGSSFLLAARQCEIAELEQPAHTGELVGAIGRLIHAMQRERGICNVFLSSRGARFAMQRTRQVVDCLAAEQELRARFERLDTDAARVRNGSRLFSRVAVVLHGMEGLSALRERIADQAITAGDATVAFSRLVTGLLAVVFEAADAATDPHISRALVAMFNFMQGKEFAGQERAFGARSFTAGAIDLAGQQQWRHLIDAQQGCFQAFADFSDLEVLRADQASRDPLVMSEVERRRHLPHRRRQGALCRRALPAARGATRIALPVLPHHRPAARPVARHVAHRHARPPVRPRAGTGDPDASAGPAATPAARRRPGARHFQARVDRAAGAASDEIGLSQAFIAMHWGSEYLSGMSSTGERLGGVNAITTSAYCPMSKQPELKHAAVKILKAELPWTLVGMAWLPPQRALEVREELKALMERFPFAACVPFSNDAPLAEAAARERAGVLFRAAAYEPPTEELVRGIETLLGLAGTDTLRYADKRKGQVRSVRARRDGADLRIEAILLAGDTRAEAWLKALLLQVAPAQAYGRFLLAPGHRR